MSALQALVALLRRTVVVWAFYVVHNVVAHPLLVFFPPLGEWLHDVTGDIASERVRPFAR